VIFALAAAMSAAMAVAARPPPVAQPLTVRRFDSAVAAIRAALESDPVVVAFGEWHQTRATEAVPSALQRFTAQILPAFGGRFSHLILETWVTTGRCGEIERAVTDDVQKATERPPQTENEIEALLRAAVSARVAPRILSISCADYAAMRPAGQPVDYDRTLRITTRALEEAALAALRERVRGAARTPARPPNPDGGAVDVTDATDAASGRSLIGIYGGALHNDLHPEPELGAYSFGPKLLAATLGRVLEVDLVVPEYAGGSAAVRAQSWWKAYARSLRLHRGLPGRAEATLMVRRSERSVVIIFPPVSKAHSLAP
jgi:hypothetical protein